MSNPNLNTFNQNGTDCVACNPIRVTATFGRLTGLWLLVLAVVTACGGAPESIRDSSTRHIDRVSKQVAEVATQAGIPVDPGGTVAVAHSVGGSAVFMPAPHDDGRLVGWLDLPETNPCATQVPTGYYVIEPQLSDSEANLTLREIAGTVKLENVRSALERKDDDNAPHSTFVQVALGPENFSSWGWHRCSDGVGCCRWALTLNDSTPGCK